MKRTIGVFATFLAAILLLMLYEWAGWRIGTPPERALPAGILAAVLLAAAALVLHLAADRALNELNIVVPFSYLILSTAHPAALYYTPLHAAALLLALSLYFFLDYCASHPTIGNEIATGLTLGASALFFPPLLWLAPVYGFLSVGRTEDKLKFCVAGLLSTALPLAAGLAVQSLLETGDTGAFLPGLWQGMTAVTHPAVPSSATSLCRILLTVILTITAIVRVLQRTHVYRTFQIRSMTRLILLTVFISALALLFLSDGKQPAGLITSLPVALLVNDLFIHPDHRKGTLTLVIILILVLVAERISYFV